MARARCPECDELVPITPTGRKQADAGTAEWWRILEHKSKGDWCTGSGRLI